MSDHYIMTAKSQYPQTYVAEGADHAKVLADYCQQDPEAFLVTCEAYQKAEVERTMAKFPLTRVTERFYEHMLGILPPIYSRFSPGWFVSEPVVQRVYTQFIEHKGRFYAGYANLSMTDRKCWTIADIEALEASGNVTEVDWFTEDS